MGSAPQKERESCQDTLEVAHFFGEGDGRNAFDRLLEDCQGRHSSISITEQVYSNNAHDLNVKSRFLRKDPPDVFFEWPGSNLDPYYRAGALLDLTEMWETNGLKEAFIDGPRKKVTFDGDIVGVPFDIHRKNNLFYNVELAEQRGINPSRIDDPRELLEVLEQLAEGSSIVGLEQPMKNPWTVLQLWSQILIGQFGASAYREVTEGDARSHEREIEASLQILDGYIGLAREHSSFLGMVEANERFIDGQSVFFHQGDWVAGAYDDVEGFDYQSDWGHVPFPGTDGVYVMAMDAVVAGAGSGKEADAKTFLEFVASPQALEAVNRIKGSIPPRRDISLDQYPPFLQNQYDNFKQARDHPGGNKSQVPAEAFMDARSAFAAFVEQRDVQATTRELIEAYG
ncbi:ABC transporter substrate-binding protein [Halorhabdus salina]|uniref:ABC transporter substrate-binding protein n=1 Tax=Halorhabdus salina TaxID=2750670 RepID=UPI0015EE7E58|nr:ABC transporter substrate-binding protein [Halorhabdus salina]